MRRELLGLVAVAWLLGWAAPAAATPVRDCSTRAEGRRPVRQLVARGDVQVGPVAFTGLARVAEPRELNRFGTRVDGRIVLKAALKVRAGRVVTVSVTPLDPQLAIGLDFLRGDAAPAVKFFACDKDEKAFSYDGVVGSVTGFPGGFTLSEPQCAIVRARVRGHRFVYTRLVSFGMGQVSGNCDKL